MWIPTPTMECRFWTGGGGGGIAAAAAGCEVVGRCVPRAGFSAAGVRSGSWSPTVIEKLYRERWGPEDGVGCIILSPTKNLAGQIFEVINKVGQFHNFSAGAIVGKRKGIEQEKERVNSLNILVCTTGRLVQHFNETVSFDCSLLQFSRHILFYDYRECQI